MENYTEKLVNQIEECIKNGDVALTIVGNDGVEIFKVDAVRNYCEYGNDKDLLEEYRDMCNESNCWGEFENTYKFVEAYTDSEGNEYPESYENPLPDKYNMSIYKYDESTGEITFNYMVELEL